MYVQIGSSVIIYLCSRARNNQPLLIACKSIKFFQHIQIFMKKNSIFANFRFPRTRITYIRNVLLNSERVVTNLS